MSSSNTEIQRIVLVTGVTANSLGASVAIQLALTKKYKVFGTLRSLDKKAEDFYNELISKGGERQDVSLVQLDVSDEKSCEMAIQSVGKVDILVNNAGAGFAQTLEGAHLDKVASCFQVNFFGPYRMMKLCIPAMRKQKWGRIINVSSVGGIVGQPFNEAYCASKAALDSLAESSNATLRSFNIYVSTFCPGAILSNFVSAVHTSSKKEDFGEGYEDLQANYLERMRSVFNDPAFKKMQQTPADAAADICNIIEQDNPDCRYVTKQGQVYADMKFNGAGQSGEAVVSYFQKIVTRSAQREQ